MPRRRTMPIEWPFAGLDRTMARQSQPPYTTPDCMNVRPRDVFEGRLRGGSRPGMVPFYTTGFTNNTLTNISEIEYSTDSSGQEYCGEFLEEFTASDLGVNWSGLVIEAGVEELNEPLLQYGDYAYTDTVKRGAAIRPFDGLNRHNNRFLVELFLVPYQGSFNGTFTIVAGMDYPTHELTEDGLSAQVTLSPGGAYDARLRNYYNGNQTGPATGTGTVSNDGPGWLVLEVDDDVQRVYWQGKLLASQSLNTGSDRQSGPMVGFWIDAANSSSRCIVDRFRVRVSLTGEGHPAIKRLVVADTDLYYAPLVPTLNDAGTGLGDLVKSGYADITLNSTWDYNNPVQSAVFTDAARGTAVYFALTRLPDGAIYPGRVVYFNPITNEANFVGETEGWPMRCPLIAVWDNRIVLGGALSSPRQWYACRQGDSTDWDVSADLDDTAGAISGGSTDVPEYGQPLTAIIGHANDYLLMAGETSLHMIRGNPRAGGIMGALSRVVGIVGKFAWCWGPSQELFFLSKDGLMVLAPGASSFPQPISTKHLPRDLVGVDGDQAVVTLAYDSVARGLHIGISPKANPAQTTHWWYDFDTQAFWPLNFASGYASPLFMRAMTRGFGRHSNVLWGDRDGRVRIFNNDAGSDVDLYGNAVESFTSYVLCGPFHMGAFTDGVVHRVQGALATRSGNVSLGILPGDTADEAAAASAAATATLAAGRNAIEYPRVRCGAFFVKLSHGTTGRPWAFEGADMELLSAGMSRPL